MPIRKHRLRVPLLTLLSLAVAGVVVGSITGFFTQATGIATGMGAKLLCSAEFIMHQNPDAARQDLNQYSPLLSQLTVRYDREAAAVTADFLSLSPKTAHYLPGLGCAVNYSPQDPRLALISPIPIYQPTAMWPQGDGTPAPNPKIERALHAWIEQDNAEGLNTRALVVVQDGVLLAQAYAQGTTPETPLLGWSMAKSVTAVLLGNLEYRRRLDTTQPLFPHWADDSRSAITLTDLFTMTDGLDFSEAYLPGDDATAMLFNRPEAAAYALDRPLKHTPGTQFNYSSGTANILARLYADQLGGPQAALDDFAKNIMAPLGLQGSVFETDASGHFVGSSYFYATAKDWARFGLLMLNKGEINGHRILSEDWVERATSPNSSTNYRAYGYQWWLNRGNEQLRFPKLPADTFFASGNRRQFLMVFPSQRVVVVRLGWTAGDYPTEARFRRILDQL